MDPSLQTHDTHELNGPHTDTCMVRGTLRDRYRRSQCHVWETEVTTWSFIMREFSFELKAVCVNGEGMK